MTALEQRLTRMEDIEAIKQLKAEYCDICDDDHNPDRITTIFAEDGIWEGAGFGKAQGHAAIRELFKKIPDPDQLLPAPGAEPGHQDRRRPGDRYLVLFRAVYVLQKQPGQVAGRPATRTTMSR